MRGIRSATYIGPVKRLKGEGALVQFTCDGGATMVQMKDTNTVIAQFDNHAAKLNGVMLAFGWHQFAATDFQIDDEVLA